MMYVRVYTRCVSVGQLGSGGTTFMFLSLPGYMSGTLTDKKFYDVPLSYESSEYILSKATSSLRQFNKCKPVWTDGVVVFKVWFDYDMVCKEMEISNKLYEFGLAPKVFSVWANPGIREWVSISEFVPETTDSLSEEEYTKVFSDLKKQLEILGYRGVDWNPDNFGFKNGQIMCFDFESWILEQNFLV